MGVQSVRVALLVASVFNFVVGDGDHAHAHVEGATPTGTVTTVHSATGDSNDAAFATIAKALSDNPALAAAAASALGGGGAAQGGAYNYPSPPAAGGANPYAGLGGLGALGALGGLGGLGGGIPFLPWGFGKGLHLNVDAGAGFGGLGAYYPIIEKAIVIVGGGILILLIIAFIHGSLSPGGFLHALGGSFSKAFAGSASVDVGPFHNSASGAAALNLNDGVHVGGARLNDPRFNQNVNNAVNRHY